MSSPAASPEEKSAVAETAPKPTATAGAAATEGAVVEGAAEVAPPKVIKEGAAPRTQTGAAGDDDAYYPEEEVTEGNWNISHVAVAEVKVETGEEGEELFWSQRSKLYRWATERNTTADAADSTTNEGSGEWKERGIGIAKLLKHTGTGKIRFLLRQEKTLKIVANHYVFASGVYCSLKPNVGSEKIWVWTVMDSADEPRQLQQFALKFGQVAQAQIFKEKFEAAARINAALVDEKEGKNEGDKEAEEKPIAQPN
eukprot:GHVT01087348.1.p1 GENE.GHVT01087348.1~~GHVT01087348.1.p1  ORF type:complete len:255 (+),score=69.64 GHVT01087348.1:529-1293(+)